MLLIMHEHLGPMTAPEMTPEISVMVFQDDAIVIDITDPQRPLQASAGLYGEITWGVVHDHKKLLEVYDPE